MPSIPKKKVDNNLSCSTISHLNDVDALLQGVDLHTIDSVDTIYSTC